MKSLLVSLSFLALAACNDRNGTPLTIVESGSQYSGQDKDLEANPDKSQSQEDSIPASQAPKEEPDSAAGNDPAEPESKDTVIPTPAPMGILANGIYTIKGVGSRKCLAPMGSSKVSAAAVVQETCSSDVAQKWQFTFIAENIYSITNMNSMMALEVKDAIVKNLAPIQQGAYLKGAHQQFLVALAKDGTYNLKPKNDSKLCMDVSFASMDNNAAIQLWYECTNVNEQWIILPAAP